jgi:bifunctional DNase/RNase
MELLGVRVDASANAPLILLQETEGKRRVLPIYIGGPEAASIDYALRGTVAPRPLTHDLMVNVLGQLDVQLVQVVVTGLVEHTFYAELVLRTGTEEQRVSSRPSDAVALAVRTGTPIWASDEVLEAAGQLPAEESDGAEENPEELVDEFRQFIENISPEDFGG